MPLSIDTAIKAVGPIPTWRGDLIAQNCEVSLACSGRAETRHKVITDGSTLIRHTFPDGSAIITRTNGQWGLGMHESVWWDEVCQKALRTLLIDIEARWFPLQALVCVSLTKEQAWNLAFPVDGQVRRYLRQAAAEWARTAVAA